MRGNILVLPRFQNWYRMEYSAECIYALVSVGVYACIGMCVAVKKRIMTKITGWELSYDLCSICNFIGGLNAFTMSGFKKNTVREYVDWWKIYLVHDLKKKYCNHRETAGYKELLRENQELKIKKVA